MSVKCHCGAVSTMALLGESFFHLGSFKGDRVKHFIIPKHEPCCLWCGFEFEAIKKVLKGAK